MFARHLFFCIADEISAVIFSPLLSPMMVAGAEGLAGSYTPTCFGLKQPAIKL